MYYFKKLPLLLALIVLVYSCTSQENNSQSQEPSRSEQILGYWQLREINNGVIYRAHFDLMDQLYQYFEDQTGYARKRFGTWQVSGDTLYISERQGDYALVISELTDSLLLLVKPDSMTMVFDRISEEDLPGQKP